MATLPEEEEFVDGVYQLETTDPALGGPPNRATKGGVLNIPLLDLANRTRWLKARVDTLLETVVEASTAVAGVVRLSSATNSTATNLAATPSAVKAAMDNANTRVPNGLTISTGGLATGGGDLSANRTITVPDATEAEAVAGTATNRAMSPLRVAQAIVKVIADGVAQAGSEILSAISGLSANGLIARTANGAVAVRAITGTANQITVTNGNGVSGNPTISAVIATQAEAEAGTNSVNLMTPQRVAAAIDALGVAKILLISHYVETSGAGAQILTANTWTRRSLSVVERNDIPGASLVAGNNSITLPPGDYLIESYCSSGSVQGHDRWQSRIMSGSSVIGASEQLRAGGQWGQNHTPTVVRAISASSAIASITIETRNSRTVADLTPNAAQPSLVAQMLIQKIG